MNGRLLFVGAGRAVTDRDFGPFGSQELHAALNKFQKAFKGCQKNDLENTQTKFETMVRPQTYLTINLPNRDQVGINSGSIQGRFGVDSGSIRYRFGVDAGLIWSIFAIDSGSIRSRFGVDSGSIPDRFGIDSGTIWGRFVVVAVVAVAVVAVVIPVIPVCNSGLPIAHFHFPEVVASPNP